MCQQEKLEGHGKMYELAIGELYFSLMDHNLSETAAKLQRIKISLESISKFQEQHSF